MQPFLPFHHLRTTIKFVSMTRKANPPRTPIPGIILQNETPYQRLLFSTSLVLEVVLLRCTVRMPEAAFTM